MEKEMATHSSVLAWRIPGMAGPGGLPSMGSHRVGHDWSELAAAAAAVFCGVKVSATKVFPCGNLKLTPFPLKGGQVIWTNSPILQTAVPAKSLRVRKWHTSNSCCLRSVRSIRITIWRRQWPVQIGLLIYLFLAMLHGMRDFSSRIRDQTSATYTGRTVSEPLDIQGSPQAGLLYFDYLPFL